MPSFEALLSPLDQFMPAAYTACFLILPNCDGDADRAVRALNRGLAKTCRQMPFLQGSMFISDQNGHHGVVWSDDDPPVQMVEAAAPELRSYAELEANDMPFQLFKKHLLPASTMAPSLSSNGPVFAVSFVKIKGGLIICPCVHHKVTDGTGRGILFNRWAVNTRTEGEAVPWLDSTYLHSRNSRLNEAISALSSLDSNDTPQPNRNVKPGTAANPPAKPDSKDTSVPAVSHSFTFSCRKLDALSVSVSSELSNSTPAPSKNNLVSALLWSRIAHYRLQRLQEHDPSAGLIESRLNMATNMRKHVFPSASEAQNYFGNLITSSPAKLTYAQLASTGPDKENLSIQQPTSATSCGDENEDPVSQSNGTIAAVLRRSSSERANSQPPLYPKALPHVLTTLISSQNTQAKLRNLAGMQKRAMDSLSARNLERSLSVIFNGRDITVTSWANFPFFVDFGPQVGKVQWVRSEYFTDIDGLILVLPRKRKVGEDGEERIEVLVGVREDDMAGLVEDEYLKEVLV